jgi:hypothetical protein
MRHSSSFDDNVILSEQEFERKIAKHVKRVKQ